MRRLIMIAGGAALIIIALVVLVPVLVPASAVKDDLETYVRSATGRDLMIEGQGRFRLFPAVGVTFDDVRLSGPDGNPERPFLRAEAVTVEVGIWSAVTGSVRLDSLTLEQAIIDLRMDASGGVNWEFSANEPFRPGLAVSHAGAAAGPGLRVGIRQVQLKGSTIRYHAPDEGVPLEISDANLVMRWPDAQSAATLTGAFSARGRRMEIEAGLETPQDLRRGEPAQLIVDVDSAFSNLRFDGNIDTSADRPLRGSLTASASNAAEVFAFAGASAAPMIDTISLEGRLAAGQNGLRVSQLRAVLDDMTASGTLDLAMTGPRPALGGDLRFDRLILDKLRLRPVPVRTDAARATGDGYLSAHAAPDDPAASRINLSGLDALDADVTIAAKAISYGELSGRDVALRARLEDALLAVRLAKLSLYDGSGAGRMELSGHQGVPVVSAKLELEGVNTLPLLSDASDFDWVSGRMTGTVNVASGGETLEGMRKRLRGEARLTIRDGALEGLDLPGMLARLQAGDLGKFRRREGEQTRFDRLQANWTVSKGVAATQDLLLEGHYVQAEGKGKINLRTERLDIRLSPRVTPRSADEGSAQPVEIPVRIQGDWADPVVYPDVEKVLEDPESTLGAAKSFGKAVEKMTGGQVSEDDVRNAIDDLLGGRKK